MNLPKEFPELSTLLEKMSAPFRKFEPLIEIEPYVPVIPDEYVIIDEKIPVVQNRKAVLYLEDALTYLLKYNDYPKYHVMECRTLQGMKRSGQYSRYHASIRTDGRFLVRLSENGERSLHKLNICKNCLDLLREQYGAGVFPTDPSAFPLADWFEIIEGSVKTDQTEPADDSFDYESEGWIKRSLDCRQKANWKCQKCSVNLEGDHHLLHAHHKWGTHYSAPDDLIALCIRCHSQQPGGGHSILTTYPEYQEFMKKYGDISQSLHQTELQNWQSTAMQEDYAFSFSQDNTTDEDIPF